MWVEKTAAASVSVSKSRRAVRTARRPQTNSTRTPCFTFSVLRSRMQPICPVLRTWVPPQAFRSKSRMSISRSFSRSAGGILRTPMRARFVGRGEANLDRTVFGDDLVRQRLGRFQLLGGQPPRSRDRWCSSPRPCETKRSRSCRASRTPPRAHAVRSAAACDRDGARRRSCRAPSRPAARPEQSPSTKCSTSPVCSSSVTSFTRMRAAPFAFQPAGIEDLAAAGGIERRAIESDGVAVDGDHASFEFVEEGIGVVEALGQGEGSGQNALGLFTE